MRFQRHHDAHVLWHAGAVAHATALMMERFEARYLLASGPAEVFAEYKEHLPSALAQRLEAHFAVPIDAAHGDIAEVIAPYQSEVEEREEVATIERLNQAISGGRALWGLDETLAVLSEGRVRALVVEDGFRVPGHECRQCGRLGPAEMTDCPNCRLSMKVVDDIVDVALERALLQDATLEIVRSERGRSALEGVAQIGVILRY